MAEAQVQKYKIEAVDGLKATMDKSRSFIFTDYRGISVAQFTEIREALREAGAEIHVVKNNFAKIAFSQLELKDVGQYLTGPTAIAYCGDEAGPVAKVLFKMAREMPIKVKGGLLEGEVYDSSAVESFSKLPSKIELIQMLMGTMQAPVSNVVYVLDGVLAKLVRTVDAVREQKSRES